MEELPMTSSNPIPLPGREVHAAAAPDVHNAHRDAQDWWVPIFRGGWLMIVGFFALYSPPTSLFAVSLLFATAAFVSAGVLITNGISLRSPIAIAQGVLSMAVAAAVAFMPRDMWMLVVLSVALWAIAMGAIDIVIANRHAHMRGRAFIAAAGMVAIVAGVLGLAAPRFSEYLPISAFGLLAVLSGGALVGYGLRRRRRKGRVSAEASAHRDEERRDEERREATA
jgi:uncharacterized membrane protein HdeD (DUF308 family)